jgi:FecR protein
MAWGNWVAVRKSRLGLLLGWFVVSLIFALCIPFLSPFVAQNSAQNSVITQAQLTKILSGDQVYVQEKKAKLKDIARISELVRTGASRAEFTFNNQAIARLAPNSRMAIGNCGTQLQQGQALFTGAVSACTPTVTAAVRGTTYTVEIDSEASERINVLEGEVSVVRSKQLPNDRGENWKVSGGEDCRINTVSREIEVKPLEEQRFRRLLKGRLFKGFDQDSQRLARIEKIYTRLYPGRRFPLRSRLDPNRGNFSLTIRQKRPLLSQVVVRLSLQIKRGETFLSERLIGNFNFPINQSASFAKGLNPEDRVVVRIYDLQNRFLGYTVLELLDENALVNIILPDVEQAYGKLRTFIATDRDRNNQIDPDGETLDYYTSIVSNQATEPNEKLVVNFIEDTQALNPDFFNISGLPNAPNKSTFPDSFTEELFAIATRPNFPFQANLSANLKDAPSRVIPVKPNPNFDVLQEILKNRANPINSPIRSRLRN